MEDDDDAPWQQQDEEHGQVGGAGLQRFAVQSRVPAAEAHHGDPQVGERYAARRGRHGAQGAEEPVDLVDHHVLTGQLEQGGVVAELLWYYWLGPN